MVSDEWFHLVLVFYGPEDGISVFVNGSYNESDFTGNAGDFGEASGNVILGKVFADRDIQFADVNVDEMYFWDLPLGAVVIEQIYDSYWTLLGSGG